MLLCILRHLQLVSSILLWTYISCRAQYLVQDMEIKENILKSPGGRFSITIERDRIGGREIIENLNKHAGEITNIEDILTPFTRRHCLTVVSSFKIVDFLGLKSPIILRKIKPVEFRLDIDTGQKTIWFPANPAKNGSSKLYCTSDKYFETSLPEKSQYFMRSFCTDLVLRLFASATKPWTCLFEVNVFLPDFMPYIDRGFSRIHGLEYPTPFEFQQKAPLVPRSFLFIEEPITKLPTRYKYICTDVTYGMRDRMNWFHKTNAELPGSFFVAILNQPTESNNSRFIRLIQSYEYCKLSSETLVLDWDGFDHSTLHSKEKVNFWELRLNKKWFKLEYNNILHQCDGRNIFQQLSLSASARYDIRRIPLIQAYILTTILKNFTYPVELDGRKGNWLCTKSRGVSEISRNYSKLEKLQRRRFRDSRWTHMSIPYSSLFFINHTSEAFRFVAVVRKGTTPIPFWELVRVFQTPIWIVSMSVLICSGVAINRLTNSKEIVLQLISIVKCLLEQGDPFSNKVCMTGHIKLLLAGIFGAGILLSNAYKSNNVYNMIASRKLLPFETLSELESEQFLIYTRLVGITTLLCRPYLYPPVDCTQREEGSVLPNITHKWREGTYSMHPISGFYDACNKSKVSASIYTEFLELKGEIPWNWTLSSVDKLLQVESVPKKLLSLIMSKLSDMTEFPRNLCKKEFDIVQPKLNRYIREKEELVLIDELKAGKKVVVVVPISVALKLKTAQELRSTNLYVGKETYASGIRAFEIAGSIHLSLLRRIWGMRESGIISWWAQLFDRTGQLVEDQNDDVVEPAKISGNILVIFVVWFTGIMLSLLAIAWETKALAIGLIRTKLSSCATSVLSHLLQWRSAQAEKSRRILLVFGRLLGFKASREPPNPIVITKIAVTSLR